MFRMEADKVLWLLKPSSIDEVNHKCMLFSFLAVSPGPDSHASMEHLPASEQILQTLSELARSFQEMADRCLLVLHLEVRWEP